MLVGGPSTGDPVAPPAGVPAAAMQPESSSDVQAIVDAHIFGEASPDDEPVVQAVDAEMDNLADTRLTNLVLKGTVAATPSEKAVAIIADGNKDEDVYMIGSQVTSGAKLHAVYADRVVLNENGVLTNLKLPKEYPATAQTQARRTATAPTRATTATTSIQSVVAQNVSKLADVIRPTPYFVNGQQQGYRVYPGRNREAFSKLGLRPGDLIKDIDGQSLTDPTQAMQIFESLGESDQVSVTVERNGEPQVIVLSTSQLDLGDETSQ